MDIQPITTALTSLSSSVTPTKANATDVARLRELMESADSQPPPATSAIPEETTQKTNTLGDRILNALDKTSDELKEKWQNIDSLINGSKEPSTQDMLRAQAELMQVAVQYQVVGKVVTRSTKNIEDLLKVQ